MKFTCTWSYGGSEGTCSGASFADCENHAKVGYLEQSLIRPKDVRFAKGMQRLHKVDMNLYLDRACAEDAAHIEFLQVSGMADDEEVHRLKEYNRFEADKHQAHSQEVPKKGRT